jgi:hypothetical protein
MVRRRYDLVMSNDPVDKPILEADSRVSILASDTPILAPTATKPSTPEPQAIAPPPGFRFSEALDRSAPVEMGEGEHVLRVIYRHPVNLLPIAFSTVVILALTAAASFAMGLYGDRVSTVISLATAVPLLWILALLVSLIFVVAYLIYRQNRIVLTTHNLMQVEQFGLFNRVISKLSLANVEDVTGARKGVFATLLDYGDLIVETAGEEENFVFHQAPHPAGQVHAINQAHEALLRNRRSNRGV